MQALDSLSRYLEVEFVEQIRAVSAYLMNNRSPETMTMASAFLDQSVALIAAPPAVPPDDTPDTARRSVAVKTNAANSQVSTRSTSNKRLTRKAGIVDCRSCRTRLGEAAFGAAYPGAHGRVLAGEREPNVKHHPLLLAAASIEYPVCVECCAWIRANFVTQDGGIKAEAAHRCWLCFAEHGAHTLVNGRARVPLCDVCWSRQAIVAVRQLLDETAPPPPVPPQSEPTPPPALEVHVAAAPPTPTRHCVQCDVRDGDFVVECHRPGCLSRVCEPCLRAHMPFAFDQHLMKKLWRCDNHG